MLCGVFWEWRGLPQSLVTLGEMIMKDHESWWFSHACQFFFIYQISSWTAMYPSPRKDGSWNLISLILILILIDRYWNSIRMVLSPEISCSVFHPFQKTIRRERRLATRSSPRLVTLQRSWERSAVFSGKSWTGGISLKKRKKEKQNKQSPMNICFIGGLEPWNLDYLWLSIQLGMECHHPNWRSPSFFKMVKTTNQF